MIFRSEFNVEKILLLSVDATQVNVKFCRHYKR